MSDPTVATIQSFRTVQAHVNFIFWMTSSSSRWPRKCLAVIISDYFVMYVFIDQFVVIWKRIALLESNNKLCEATCLPRNAINASESSTTMDSFSVLACYMSTKAVHMSRL